MAEGIVLFKDVKTIQKPKNLLNALEAFQRGAAIEQLLNMKSGVQQLFDSFQFGSAQEQIDFESLCFKWTIKHFKQLIPKEGSYEQLSDIFPVYGYQLKVQLKLSISLGGSIYLYLCFKDEESESQEVDIKPLPILTFIVKDLSGQNKHYIRYNYHLFNSSLQYNHFGYGIGLVKPHWKALISTCDASLEVLVLVEPPTIIYKPWSVDGTITDTVEHYSRKLQMTKDGLIRGHWSPAFLTHAGGFRVAVEISLTGFYFKGGLGAGIRFLSGECDSQLRREFEHETSVTLINQLDANKDITVQKQAKETIFYWLKIASGDAIGSGGYIVNDSLTYHVTIKRIKK